MSTAVVGVGGLRAVADELLGRAVAIYRDDPARAAWLAEHRERLHGPLRIAVAGKVKAGKSTLLNALVGEQIAPVDAGECTKVVTWYQQGRTPAVTVHPRSGTVRALPVIRRDGALRIDLGDMSAEDVDHLRVVWPTSALGIASLIDTPGIASLTAEQGRATRRFLDPDDERPSEADAVIYLMRHLHATDAELLEAFRDQGVTRAASVNSLAVISRADEIGSGRADAMVSARAVARRYRTDPSLRGLCQDVVAVAGLVAETGRTLHHAEFAALADLAGMPRDDVAAALVSTDRFLDPHLGGPVAVLPESVRQRLLRRFGVFGVRLSLSLVRQGATTPAQLAAELVARSGLGDLQHALDTRFVGRTDLLKTRSALLALYRVIQECAPLDHGALASDVERVLAGAHEFVELRLLADLGAGAVTLPEPLAEEARRLLGEEGTAPWRRLGLDPSVEGSGIDAAVADTLLRWQVYAEDPMFSRTMSAACRVVVRSCEGMAVPRSDPGRGGGASQTAGRSGPPRAARSRPNSSSRVSTPRR